MVVPARVHHADGGDAAGDAGVHGVMRGLLACGQEDEAALHAGQDGVQALPDELREAELGAVDVRGLEVGGGRGGFGIHLGGHWAEG